MKYMCIVVVVLCAIIWWLTNQLQKEKRKVVFYQNSEQRLFEKNGQLFDKIKLLENELIGYEYFNSSLSSFRFNKAIKIVKNKAGDLYIVMEDTHDSAVDFYFSGKRHKGIMNCPRILSDNKGTHLWINDVFAIDENIGNGSILLQCLFDKAKELKIEYIKGELSPVDVGKFDKLEYFYKKNGFEVSFNADRTHGRIEKKIEL